MLRYYNIFCTSLVMSSIMYFYCVQACTELAIKSLMVTVVLGVHIRPHKVDCLVYGPDRPINST